MVMVSLGFLINLAGLLLSPPDGVSELTGYELVQTKVRRQTGAPEPRPCHQVAAVLVMGGVYPSSGPLSSFNFNCARYLIFSPEECEGAAMTAVENMPPEVRLVFSGNHVGDNVWTGGCLSSRQASILLSILS